METNKEIVDEILVSLNIALRNIVSIANNIDERLNVNKDHIDSMAGNLEQTSKNLEEMSHDLKLHPWKIMNRGKENVKGEKDSEKE